MIDFTQVDAAISLTGDYILSKLSEEQIFFYYFGPFQLGKVYPSKLRRDSSPSTGFYINKTGHIIYNDLSTGEKCNCFTFVSKLFHLTYTEALNKIAHDFGLIKASTIQPIAQKLIIEGIEFDREIKKDTLIQFIPKPWDSVTLAYWNQYELSIDRLTKAEIYPVRRLFINKNEIKDLDELCFAYIVRDKGRIYVKIYSPFSKRMKWVSNIPLTIPFGLDSLKYGTEHLIITKAKKDMEVLRMLFPSVIGTQNESISALPDKLVKHLCFNFPKRTIIWDADETGVKNCKLFNMKGFGYFNTPNYLLIEGIKDVSDYVERFGLLALELLLKEKGIL